MDIIIIIANILIIIIIISSITKTVINKVVLGFFKCIDS